MRSFSGVVDQRWPAGLRARSFRFSRQVFLGSSKWGRVVEERLRDVVCVAHRMRTRKLVDANLDYLRNGQGVPIARGRTGENVLKSEEFKRQSIETHVKKKKASFKGVRGEEPVDKWHRGSSRRRAARRDAGADATKAKQAHVRGSACSCRRPIPSVRPPSRP